MRILTHTLFWRTFRIRETYAVMFRSILLLLRCITTADIVRL